MGLMMATAYEIILSFSMKGFKREKKSIHLGSLKSCLIGRASQINILGENTQTPSRVVVRYSHHTPLQWAK